MADGKILVPGEDGVLVTSDYAEYPEPLSETERVLSLAVNSGGSGLGMSHYSAAARCGRRARLSQVKYQSFKDTGADLPVTKNAFIIGSVYHKLHELARKPNNDETLDLNERYQNPNVAEGVRLYKGWLRTWGRDFWGKCLGVELKLEDSSTFVSPLDLRIDRGDKGEVKVTAALDMVVEMDEAACERAKRRGAQVHPGRWIVDWKTSDGPSNGVAYAEGLQALWYCHVYNLHHPDAPVEGIIFDVVNKRARRKDRTVQLDDFQAHVVPCGLETVDSLRGLVLQGHRNVVEDIPNRAECVDWQGNVCPFRASGECDAK